MAVVNPYGAVKKPKGNAFWDQRLNEGLFGQTYRGQPQGGAVGRGQGGGGNPYGELINNMLNQQRADTRAESVGDAASRDAAIRRLLVSWGETPDLGALGISGEASGVLGGVMDERTQQLAAQNTAEGTSAKARIEAANQTAQRQIPAQYAGRGLLRTGQTGHALEQQAQTHKQTLFDSLNEMLGGVESAVGSYAANERQRQRQLAEAEQQAAWQSAQMWDDTDFGGGETAGQGPNDAHPMDDPYWQNLINYYETNTPGGRARIAGKPTKKYQRMGPYGPYGPAVMPRGGMR